MHLTCIGKLHLSYFPQVNYGPLTIISAAWNNILPCLPGDGVKLAAGEPSGKTLLPGLFLNKFFTLCLFE